jgi:hypothetical protein
VSLTTSSPPSEVIFGGPLTYQAAGTATAGWVQVAGAVTTIQNLVTGVTGASGATGFTQPVLPPGPGFWHPGLVIKIIANGIASWVATASTTITWSFGVTTAPQAAATGAAAGTPITLITSQVYPNQSTAQTNVPWRFDIDLLVRQVGYGTTAVSTSILATGVGGFMPAVVLPVASIAPYGPLPPNVVTAVDTSVNNWVWGAITFGTNGSASNTCTMLDMIVKGEN